MFATYIYKHQSTLKNTFIENSYNNFNFTEFGPNWQNLQKTNNGKYIVYILFITLINSQILLT